MARLSGGSVPPGLILTERFKYLLTYLLSMKRLLVIFEEEDFEKLVAVKVKLKLNWQDFILTLLKGGANNGKSNISNVSKSTRKDVLHSPSGRRKKRDNLG